MALHHASSGELIELLPPGAGSHTATTQALYRSGKLEVFRKALLAGDTMPAHTIRGEHTIQCLEGRIEVTPAGRPLTLRPGNLVCVAGGVENSVKAIEDSAFLVTILLPGV